MTIGPAPGYAVTSYINGTVVTNLASSTRFCGTQGGTLVLGQEQDAVGGGFNAAQAPNMWWDSLRIHTALLSRTEIAAIAGGGHAGLVFWSHYCFNDPLNFGYDSGLQGKNFQAVGGTSDVGLSQCGNPAPTAAPTTSPTYSPIAAPTDVPTTAAPSTSPTDVPTVSPTFVPTTSPTDIPTVSPTTSPTNPPTTSPTVAPTTSPTFLPTASPTNLPSVSPTNAPSAAPTAAPVDSSASSSSAISPGGSGFLIIILLIIILIAIVVGVVILKKRSGGDAQSKPDVRANFDNPLYDDAKSAPVHDGSFAEFEYNGGDDEGGYMDLPMAEADDTEGYMDVDPQFDKDDDF